jgi:hypothetical protein
MVETGHLALVYLPWFLPLIQRKFEDMIHGGGKVRYSSFKAAASVLIRRVVSVKGLPSIGIVRGFVLLRKD